MSNTSMKRLIGTLALAGAALAASPAQAQDIQLRGPLAGARSVSRLVQHREGRFAVTPIFGISLLDEFSRDVFFGVRAEYHFADWLGVGVMGAFSPVHVNTSLTEQVSSRSPGGTVNVPSAAPVGARSGVPATPGFAGQVGRRNWMADIHLTFIPLRGKFALFQSLVADIDFFLFAGAAFVGVEERADTSLSATATDSQRYASQAARASRVAIAPTFGAGLNFYITRFLSINFEYRATPFQWNRSGTDENSTASLCGSDGRQSCAGFSDYVSTYFNRDPTRRQTVINSDDRSWSFNQMFTIGLSIYLPTSPRVGP
jgi:outer membrane beta-barrel protein